MKAPLVTIIGPTAVGKTSLSLFLAQQLGGEIVSGDSMQVYRGMDIGTAKATLEERALAPHHMIDILKPDQDFSVVQFQQLARQAIQEIQQRGHLPILVGGTGLYVRSIIYDYQFSEVVEDPLFRKEMEEKAKREGNEAIWQRLNQVDPTTAQQVHPNNLRRVIRALEVYQLTGVPISQQVSHSTPDESPYELWLIGLTMERSQLYQRIAQRVDGMMEEGLLQEVENLLHQGYDEHYTAMQSIGYKEFLPYFRGEASLEACVAQLKQNTRRFAKRQYTWFRHQFTGIHWYDVTNLEQWEQLQQTILHEVQESFCCR
ncbi:tRNA (adenosine(37)-N6)-dimethylallyltransferase MiaA [Rubeoparvulum massiliense]|uniref:tRNA (adenosine(37)-N6)-dimethylallyltransferase MiaA n=1 Tax=Rubeoparvulum massiliense TaxID=1631346 RepID=UPI00065DC768|nr:tRNA (adenosine(37)-N6)-dimethylallyltransferase MiaA [Rubeoparvulum massiliense]